MPLTMRVLIPNLAVSNPLNGSQGNYWAKARKRTAERERVLYALLETGLRKIKPPCVVRMTRMYTGKAQAMDESCGLNAALKSVRDSVAYWLDSDDGPGSGISWEYGQVRSDATAVVIEIEETR